MSRKPDIVERLQMRPTILRKNQFGDIETDRAATKMFDDCHALMRQAAAEIECLIAERDEARREVCDMEGKTAGGALLEARKRGWDCFKEDGNAKNA